MDHLISRRIATLLSRLDGACQRGDKIAQDNIIQQINWELAGARPLDHDPGQPKPLEVPAGVPGWMRTIIESQGLRVPHLEKALDMRKVVVAPTFGSTFGLQLKMTW